MWSVINCCHALCLCAVMSSQEAREVKGSMISENFISTIIGAEYGITSDGFFELDHLPE